MNAAYKLSEQEHQRIQFDIADSFAQFANIFFLPFLEK